MFVICYRYDTHFFLSVRSTVKQNGSRTPRSIFQRPDCLHEDKTQQARVKRYISRDSSPDCNFITAFLPWYLSSAILHLGDVDNTTRSLRKRSWLVEFAFLENFDFLRSIQL